MSFKSIISSVVKFASETIVETTSTCKYCGEFIPRNPAKTWCDPCGRQNSFSILLDGILGTTEARSPGINHWQDAALHTANKLAGKDTK